jgi:hypothetical protein
MFNMKSRYDHKKFGELVALCKATKICDEVAIIFENVGTFSNDIELQDVTYSQGDIIADFTFSDPGNLKQNIGVFNPTKLVKATIGSEITKIMPKIIADQIHVYYEDLERPIYKNDFGHIELFSLLGEKYCVKVRLIYQEQ